MKKYLLVVLCIVLIITMIPFGITDKRVSAVSKADENLPPTKVVNVDLYETESKELLEEQMPKQDLGEKGPQTLPFVPGLVSKNKKETGKQIKFEGPRAYDNAKMALMNTYVPDPSILKAISNMNIKTAQAPFSIDSQQESISTLNGNLSVETTDLTLPGRNGLSFTLGRYYDASNANLYEAEVYPNVSCFCQVTFNATQYDQRQYNGQIVDVPSSFISGRFEYSPMYVTDGTMSNTWDALGWLVYVQLNRGKTTYTEWSYPDANGVQYRRVQQFHQQTNEMFSYGSSDNIFLGWKNKAKEKTYEEKVFPIGKGWMWNIPFIKTVEGKSYLNFQGKGTYEISGNNLKGYPFQDLSLAHDTSVTVNGVRSNTVLKSIEGTYHYFGSNGRLIQIADRYDNTIKFHYSEDPTYGTVLTSIIDAIGNSINISYVSNKVILTQGDKTVTYTKDEHITYDPLPPFQQLKTELLYIVEDSLGRETAYLYDMKDVNFSLIGTNPTKKNIAALLLHTFHPTNSRTRYVYEAAPVTRSIGANAVQNAYRIASRREIVSNKAYNLRSFTYTNPQGHNTDYASSYGTNISNFYVNMNDGRTTNVFDHRKKVANADEAPQFYTNKATVTAGDEQRITTYQYDEARKISSPIQTKVQYKKGNATTSEVQTSVTYNNYGNVLTERNELGLTTTYTYDSVTHLLSSISSPVYTGQTRFTEYKRNAHGSITQMTIRNNNVNGTLIAQSEYKNFDSHGNVKQTIIKDDNRNITYETEYGSIYLGAFPTKQKIATTNANNQVEAIENRLDYYPSSGLIKSVTDGKLNTTNYQYDKGNRLIRVTHPDGSFATAEFIDGSANQAVFTDETGVKTRNIWDRLGNLIEEAVLDGTYRVLRSYEYDHYGRVLWEKDNLGRAKQIEYDAWDRIKKITNPDNSFELKEYDELNRRMISTDPEGNKWRNTTDILGRTVLTEEWRDGQYRQTSSMVYDYDGNVLSQENATDTTLYSYDVLGRVIKVKDALNKEYDYAYSLAGMLKSIKFPDGNQVLKQYDELGRLIRQTNELGMNDTYSYDLSGNMISHIDRKGQTFSYAYNNRNRLIQAKAPDETKTYSYDLSGRRQSMTDITGSTLYEYKGSTGELLKTTYPDQKSINYTYNSLGLRDSMTDPFSYATTYTYDNRNRLTGVGASATDQEVSYTYYTNNLMKNITLKNGNKTLMNYKGLRLQNMSHQKNDGSLLHSFQYGYDGNGNIINSSGSQANVAINKSYTYDPLSRIATSSEFNESYLYDNRDNRATLSTEQPINNAMFSDKSYTYDSQNRLTKAVVDGKEVTYRYNGDGLLYERTEAGVTTRYYYDGPNIIAEGTVDSNGNATFKARYVRGHQLAARQDAAGQAYYLHNGHGDVIEMRDHTGNVSLNEYTYDLWGNTLTANEQIANPFRYSGELWDSTSQLQYLRARWYDPSLGRFINKDTYEGELGSPLSLNLYTYVINNPLRYFDPSGNQHIDIGSNLDAYRSDQIKMLYLRWQLGDDSWMNTVSDDVGEQVWNMAKSDWTLEDAFKWFSAGVLTGAVLANPSAGFAALEVATTGTYTYGTVAITGGVTLAVAKLTNSKTVTTIPGLNAIAQKSLDVKRSVTGIIRSDGTVEAVLQDVGYNVTHKGLGLTKKDLGFNLFYHDGKWQVTGSGRAAEMKWAKPSAADEEKIKKLFGLN